MKLKIILGLVLLLSSGLFGHNCHAVIVYPKAPDGGREIVAKYLDPQSLKFLKVSRIEDLIIAQPFAEYYVTNLTNLSSRNFLAAAKPRGWLCLLTQGTNAVGELGLMPDKQSGKGLKFSYLKRTDSTNTTLEALRIAERLPQLKNQDYELRRLDIAPILFAAVWLHRKSDDILIPLPPTFGRWNAYQTYSESQMLMLLKPEVEKTLKAWEPFIRR
jgi:hypothetical protein